MFARTSSIIAFAALAFPILATATAVPRWETPAPTPASQCTGSTGAVQCCNSTQDSQNLSTQLTGILGLLGVVVGDLTALVGVTCSPITAIGVGGNSCNSQAVCCSNNSFNGVVALGCTPVNLSL
ncbi:fungal hydrophobin-domain-containing protein [Crucibulum laeve]|uniref:Hydrophobin n=1 Tax=Crucibulum laeve TaxID=68775 RepID=A0A5C3LXA6_9AGAR|nr:fungal hydrophobin-domain-containing protein [Crucibulum laeve]